MKKIVLALTFVLVGSFMLAGCSKDEILDHYNNIVQSAGAIELTGKSSLEGTKEKGIDDYTGTYTADYANFLAFFFVWVASRSFMHKIKMAEITTASTRLQEKGKKVAPKKGW